MVIQSSNIAMASKRSYEKKIKQSSMVTTTNTSGSNSKNKQINRGGLNLELSEEGLKMLEKLKEEKQIEASEEKEKEKDNNQSSAVQTTTNKSDNFLKGLEDLRKQTLRSLLRLLKLLSKGEEDTQEFDLFYENDQMSQNIQGISGFLGINTMGTANSSSSVVLERTVEYSYSKEEKESTSFVAQGIAVTADGRELNFQIDMEMTRSFMEQTNFSYSETVTYQLKDPLVIHLDSNPDFISDQKFLFDIDADGKKEEISMLNKGSGFLALDKNKDGKINDGTELFGTKSGNGFADLAVYDMDKNGWIDEKDPIFNDLKIWLKDENGKDILIGLGDADIGAIYLGNINTKFHLTDEEDNSLNAVVQNSGIYLKESTGQAGVIQQIDMATQE